MTVAELLISQRHWGRTRARKFLTALLIDENEQLAALTERQRRLLARALSERSASSSSEGQAHGRDDGVPSHA